jgi:hypothetical protein
MSINSRTHNAIYIGGLIVVGVIIAVGALFSGQLKPSFTAPSAIISH